MHDPRLHSKSEGMLKDVYHSLVQPEVASASAARIRKQKNEISCPIYKLSNDELKHIFGYIGEKQYGFIACASDRFHKLYLEIFDGETWTSFKSAVASVSCAKMCLDVKEWNSSSCTTTSTCIHIIPAKKLFLAAVWEGKLEVLKWGQDSGHDLKTLLEEEEEGGRPIAIPIADAALCGHLEVVNYLRWLGISWDERTCANAAMNGHLELLKWAREHECPWDWETCANAALNGHLKLLKWAREHECPWNANTCSNAAKNGHLEILKWAREHECPWNANTCSNAAENGHLAVLKWARSSGCPWNQLTYSYGSIHGDPAVMRYLEEQGCPRSRTHPLYNY